MPTLNRKDGEQKRRRERQLEAQRARPRPQRTVDPDSEGSELAEEITVATPFSDGIVSPQFRHFPSVPRAADAEVDLLRSFLRYFSVNSPFVGTVNTKVSFMKKKGGRLL